MISYRRLAPASLVDALMTKPETTDRLELRVPPFPGKQSENLEPSSMRQALHASSAYEMVLTYQMFPIQPVGIVATALPPQLWTDVDLKREDARLLWLTHLADGHYAPFADRRSILERHGEAHYTRGLGIFGITCNPLESVIAFCMPIKEYNMLKHYVAIVVLQYYLIKRGCFARVRTDADAKHFSDALPHYIFAVFRETDCRVPKVKEEEPKAPLTHENAEMYATTMPFPSFLLLVLRWMLVAHPVTVAASINTTSSNKDSATDKDTFLQFCESKISRNWVQFLNCMRFREFIPDGMCERIGESRGGGPAVTPKLKPSKFYQHPNAAQLLAIEAASVSPSSMLERIPYFFTHSCFRPDTPVLLETSYDTSETVSHVDRQKQLIWKLLQFCPIQSFRKESQTKITQAWATAGTPSKVMPTNAMQKWSEYDGYMRNMRANYSFYVPLTNHAQDAFVMISNLHLPNEVPVVNDDTDMRTMSLEAFDWCCNHGTAFDVLPPKVKQENMFFEWVVEEAYRVERTPGAVHNPYILMLAVQLVTGREEDGVATAAARNFSLLDIQQSVDVMYEKAHIDHAHNAALDPALVEQINRARLVTWDRCSPMPFPEDKLQHSVMRDRLWHFHFPVSRVQLRLSTQEVVPWITQFREKNMLAHTLEQLAKVAPLFDEKSMRELQASSYQDAVLTPIQRHQLRIIFSTFLPPATDIFTAMQRVCVVASLHDNLDVAEAASKAKIATFPLAFQNVMEEGRRLIHYDVLTQHGQIRPETAAFAERRFIMIIGDPVQVSICGAAVYEPYRHIVDAASAQLQQQQQQQQQQQH